MNKHWVAAWGKAPSCAPLTAAMYTKNTTLRYALRIGAAGSAVRLHFSNIGSDEPIPVARVTAAKEGGAAVREIRFGGEIGTVIPARGEIVSDAVEMDIKAGDDLYVSFYLKDLVPMTSGVGCTGPLCRGFFADGDHVDEWPLDIMHIVPTTTFYFLTGADILAAEDVHALVAFGDSITARPWPNYLALRLERMGQDKLCVVRRGIGGSRVLRQYENLEHLHYGRRGVDRFESEVAVDGVDRVLVLHGINDIIHPDGIHPLRPWSDYPTPDELIAGMREYIRIAHDHGIQYYQSTIMPFEGWSSFLPKREELRSVVNDWILHSGENDGAADFATATADPNCPTRLLDICDSGDHLHPSEEGSRRMAESIPEYMLR